MLSRLINTFNLFSQRERIAFGAAFFVFFVSAATFGAFFIRNKTELIPKTGGTLHEGLASQPVFINPLLVSGRDADRNIATLVFSPLEVFIDSYSYDEAKKTFSVRIKKGLTWHDNTSFTTDDIVFTIGLLQNPELDSPFAPAWKNVKIKRVSELEFEATLPTSYAYFKDTLFSLQAVPKHIFGSIPPQNLKLSDYNLRPVGNGPFQFSEFEKRRDGFITEYKLTRNDNFAGKRAYLDSVVFHFYQKEEDAIAAYNSKDIEAILLSSPQNENKIIAPHNSIALTLPRYYAVFINQSENEIFQDRNVRLALSYATNRAAISKKLFGSDKYAISGPFLFESTPENSGDVQKARDILEATGWKLNDAGIRTKTEGENTSALSFNLTVYPNSFLEQTAELIKEQWKEAGIDVSVKTFSADDFADSVIKNRNYELLLFGVLYGQNKDPHSFWHSSQKFYPGQNLAMFANKEADFIMESAQNDFDEGNRERKLRELERIVTDQEPAVFLYSPPLIYITRSSLKGIDSSHITLPESRFLKVSDWHMRQSRILKR